MSAGQLRGAKRRLRSELRDARAALSPQERATRSAAIIGHLRALPELAHASLIAAFAATATEVDLDPWMRVLVQRGVTVALPIVRGNAVDLAVIGDVGLLRPGWRGVREPPDGSPAVHPRDVDAAVVPGVGFDTHGHRLGQGGGHIDRLLASLRPDAPVIGVAFALQVVATVPVERHDVAVDVLVTEQGVLLRR